MQVYWTTSNCSYRTSIVSPKENTESKMTKPQTPIPVFVKKDKRTSSKCATEKSIQYGNQDKEMELLTLGYCHERQNLFKS